jgi:hypothetical protein
MAHDGSWSFEEAKQAMTPAIHFTVRNDHLAGPGDTEELEELEVDDLEDDDLEDDDLEDDEDWEDEEDDEEAEWEEEDFKEEPAE